MLTHAPTTYGDLIRIDPNNGAVAETLHRIPLGASTADGGLAESDIHDLLFRFPGAPPIAAIDASYAGAIPVCRELYTPAGKVDALYINPLGRLTLAEFKLWRNPQARREVIGQILDYAKELASWRYADLQREVSRTLKRKGNVLYELIREQQPAPNEAQFVDNVTRHLRRGEFLLLIVGDGIREDLEDIVGFVQRHSGLHFNLALVEAALYHDGADHIIVQPRVLARTEIMPRYVVGDGGGGDVPPDDHSSEEDLSDQEKANRRFWDAVLHDYSFSDVTVEVRPVKKPYTYAYVPVAGSGSGDDGYGLPFRASLDRKRSRLDCYLTWRNEKGLDHAKRIFDEIGGSLAELRDELGEDLERWTDAPAGQPRIGFRRVTRIPLSDDPESEEFLAAVAWMRDRLDRLVSALHPRLRRMIDAGN